jgi:hypothetical protein
VTLSSRRTLMILMMMMAWCPPRLTGYLPPRVTGMLPPRLMLLQSNAEERGHQEGSCSGSGVVRQGLAASLSDAVAPPIPASTSVGAG